MRTDEHPALTALRADLNPHLYGVFWDRREQWMATTPYGGVVVADSPDALRRAVREIDGTTAADTATLQAIQEEGS